mmetsp:Transcript_30153/g.22412  ORF Transcript_30153/g.22412 Transcript_30153/m.22412 type:complete len:164 (-) Transcript_30153:578-1069(-)
MDSTFDVIVVGLGCVGLSSCYHLAKSGYKVLGLESNPTSGALGGSSIGHARIWRHIEPDERYLQMMKISLEEWREVERATGRCIIKTNGHLRAMHKDNKDLSKVKHFGELLTSAQIHQRWPGLKLPEDFVGVHDKEAGLVMVKEALTAYRELAQLAGAILRYD